MDQSFGKAEKLKSKIVIDRLFSEGKSISRFPLKLVYLPLGELENSCHKTAVSVPKRSFKRAVDRIHLKRLMREAFRKNKYLVTTNGHCFAFMFIFVGRQKEDYHKIFKAMEELLWKFREKELKN